MFERKPLRTDVGAEILARIVDGRLPAGMHLNESRVSQDLGISRTPLREAMLGLQAEGVLLSFMGRGFQVPPLTAREINELCRVLAVIEPAALRDRDPLDGRAVMELQNLLSRARLGRTDRDGLVETFYLLTRITLDGCRNLTLRTLALRQNRLTLRYISAAVDRGWDAGGWLETWHGLAESLRRSEFETAATALAAARLALADQFASYFSEQDAAAAT